MNGRFSGGSSLNKTHMRCKDAKTVHRDHLFSSLVCNNMLIYRFGLCAEPCYPFLMCAGRMGVEATPVCPLCSSIKLNLASPASLPYVPDKVSPPFNVSKINSRCEKRENASCCNDSGPGMLLPLPSGHGLICGQLNSTAKCERL